MQPIPRAGRRAAWRSRGERRRACGCVAIVAGAVAVTAFAGVAHSALARARGRTAPGDTVASLVVVGRVWTGLAARPWAEAIAIADGRIVAVGRAAVIRRYVGPGTRRLATGRGIAVPGLVDAHAHLRGLGEWLAEVDLVGTRSVQEVVERVARAAAHGAPGAWVRGRGWDQNDWRVKRLPTWRDLEGIDRPVVLRRIDGHAVWVNRAALRRCDIGRDTPDPPGGRIERDADGQPTGILVDRATELVLAHVPPPDAAERLRRLRAAVAACNRAGLCGVHDAGVGATELGDLERLAREGDLTLRVYAMLDADDDSLLAAWFARGPGALAGGWVDVRAVKVYADGALGSRGAALLEPYADRPDTRGLLVTPPERIEAILREAFRAGFQPCVHAIGDRANRIVLDAIERLETELGAARVRALRPRIEHAQIVDPADLSRFRRLGVIPSMQPTHATSDMDWAVTRLGPDRLRGAYAWRTLLEDGNVLAFGSDFPVEGVAPMWGVHAAVTRRAADGHPPGGWRPRECLDVAEALAGFTWGAACASFAEARRGRITPGRDADVTVLDGDPFAVDPMAIRAIGIRATIVAGRVVYESSPRASGRRGSRSSRSRSNSRPTG